MGRRKQTMGEPAMGVATEKTWNQAASANHWSRSAFGRSRGRWTVGRGYLLNFMDSEFTLNWFG
jgi:hypothetical protein